MQPNKCTELTGFAGYIEWLEDHPECCDDRGTKKRFKNLNSQAIKELVTRLDLQALIKECQMRFPILWYLSLGSGTSRPEVESLPVFMVLMLFVKEVQLVLYLEAVIERMSFFLREGGDFGLQPALPNRIMPSIIKCQKNQGAILPLRYWSGTVLH